MIVNQLKDDRIIYYRQKHQNANVARNYGILRSKGAYIAMLDADDIWLPNHIEDCLNTINNAVADGLYGSVIVKDSKNNIQSICKARSLRDDENMINYLLKVGYGAQTSTLFMTAESMKNILWNETLKRHQDYDFVVRYSCKYKLVPKESPTVIHIVGATIPYIDFNSCICFIKENEQDISPGLYSYYHQNMLSLAQYLGAPPDIISHYHREINKYAHNKFAE